MNRYTVSVLLSGFLWGFMGFCRRQLAGMGIDAAGMIICRCGLAAVMFAVWIALRDPKELRFRLKDAWCFAGSGIFALLFFTFCYFQAMSYMSLSAAAILLYTAPAIVMLLSAVFFKEPLTRRKLFALALAFAGCCLVSGIGSGTVITGTGLAYGICAGIGYALYSIFARFALNRGYSTNTINFWSCLLAASGACAIFGAGPTFSAMFSSPRTFFWCIAAAFFTCFLAYSLYTYGLSGIETGKASVIASIEPVTATFVGLLLYDERLTVQSAAGVILVLAAIVLLNTDKKTGA